MQTCSSNHQFSRLRNAALILTASLVAISVIVFPAIQEARVQHAIVTKYASDVRYSHENFSVGASGYGSNNSSLDHQTWLDLLKARCSGNFFSKVVMIKIKKRPELHDLNVLKSLKHLRYLSVERCPNLEDISAIKELPLEGLHIVKCPKLHEAQVISELKQLKQLKLSSCPIDSVDGLALMNLKGLTISNCPIDDLSALDGFYLEELTLKGCSIDTIKSFPAPNLESLSLANCDSIHDLGFVQNFDQLRHISIRSCKKLANLDGLETTGFRDTSLSLHDCPALKNIDGLKGQSGLRGIRLSKCRSLQNIDVLKHTGVSDLYLHDCPALTNIDVISDLDLWKLGVVNCQGLGKGFLKKIKAVQGLEFSVFDGPFELSELSHLPTIRFLQIYKQESLTSLAGLELLPNVSTLRITECNKLENLDAIRGNKKIDILDINRCENLHSVDGIQWLANLYLTINQCPKVDDVSALGNAEHIRCLQVRRCKLIDRSEVENLTNVAELIYSPWKQPRRKTTKPRKSLAER